VSAGAHPLARFRDVEIQRHIAVGSQAGSANDLDVYIEVIGPVLPDAISGVGRAGQAPSKCQAHAVSKAQARTVPVEGGREASIEAAEGRDGDAEVIEGGIDSFGCDSQAGGLLQHLGVVDRADRGVVAGCSLSNAVSAGFVVDER
jgi:hypothetical protein